MKLKRYTAMVPASLRVALYGLLVMSSLISSCKKEGRPEIYPASITFVNAINDNTSFLWGFFKEGRPMEFIRTTRIFNNQFFHYATKYANPPVSFYLNSDTLAKDAPVSTPGLQVQGGEIYTHFIYGSKGAFRGKTIQEKIPGYSLKDSVTNLRVINLFENRSIDVEMVQPYAQVLATNLAYEQLTDFIKLPCDHTVPGFEFRLKDHLTGNVLGTVTSSISGGNSYNLPQWLYRPNTLVLSGKWTDANNSNPRVFTVRHYHF